MMVNFFKIYFCIKLFPFLESLAFSGDCEKMEICSNANLFLISTRYKLSTLLFPKCEKSMRKHVFIHLCAIIIF